MSETKALRITTIRWVYLIIALFVAIILCLVVLFQFQMDASVAIRVYVDGEGLWAKAQKDAVHSLDHYAVSHDEADYQAYLRLIQVPLGDQKARMELQKPDPNLDLVREGYLQGRLHPVDIDYAIPFFLRFQHNVYMSRVIGHWTVADRLIAELGQVAGALHEEVASGRATPGTSRPFIARLEVINRQVTEEEDLFASTLADASRWANDVSRNLTYAIALLFIALGVGLSWPLITRIRATENSLLESEEQFRSIFEHVDDIIYMVEPDGRFSSISPSSQRMLGWSADEWIGRPFALIVHPDDLSRMQALFLKAQTGESLPVFQVRILTKTGGYLESEIAVSLVHRGDSIVTLGVVRDITERKRAEEEIRKQQELTTQIIETIPMRVFWKDRDLRYLGCNSLFAKDAGLNRPDELIGKTDFDMGWKEQAEIYRADDRRVMDSNTPKLSYDEPQTTPEGRPIWLRTSKVPLRNEVDETIGMLGVYEDITGYKQVELRLLESEERFRKAFQHSAIGMALVGLDGQWLKVNNSLCQMLGYSEQELLGRTFQDITHPGDLQSDLDFVAQLLAGELDHYQMEKRYFHKDGHVVWIRLSVSLIRNAQNKPLHFVAQIDDISEDKLAAEALHKANVELSLFRTLLDNSSDAIEVMDPITLRFLDVNEKACRDLGYSREELLSMSVFDIDPSFSPASRKMIEEQMQKSGTARFEGIHRRKDGSTFPVETSIGSANLDKPYGLCVVRDITERKLAEEKIRKLNEELEERVQERTRQLLQAQEELVRKEKLAVLGQVAGSVGHELRNPLGVINNAVYFLQTVLSDADETTREYLNIIKEEVAGSERIVSDLLDSVRTKPPQVQTVGVAELLEQTLRKCSVLSSVTVKLEIPATLLPLRVDAMQIQQVLRNLISNGVEAMPEGGTLEIKAVENQQDGTITISVRDSGSGIAPEVLPKLFQPLFTTKARGIGLGLVVVKNLTEANGGSVKVQSAVGQGSVFTVTLPADQSKGT